MPFNPEETKRKTLAQLVTMAAHPGWKAQAWHTANALATDWPEMFKDLPAQLTAAMPGKSSGAPRPNGG